MTDDPAPNDLAEMPAGQRNALIGLAAEARVPVEVVADAYRREVTELQRTARIRQYLPLLASRRVRRRLRALGRPMHPNGAPKSS